eukprot:6974633-Ditylum_brightwellii.AAC.1
MEKYKDLAFHDPDYNITYTIYSKNLEFQQGRTLPKDERGWSVIAQLPEYDVTDDTILEPYKINENLVTMIAETIQTGHLIIKIIQADQAEDNSEGDVCPDRDLDE